MKILSKDETVDSLEWSSLESIDVAGQHRSPEHGSTYRLPREASRLIALARYIAYCIVSRAPLLYLTVWGLGLSTELPDLFLAYRVAHGDKRPIIDAPLHQFNATEEEQLATVLAMILLFGWDSILFSKDLSFRIITSHHEIITFQFSDPNESFSFESELSSYGLQLCDSGV